MRSISQLFWTHVAVNTKRREVYIETRRLGLSSRQSRLVWRYCRDDIGLAYTLCETSAQVGVRVMLRVVEADVHPSYFTRGIVPGSMPRAVHPFSLYRDARWRTVEEVIMMSDANVSADYAAYAPSTLAVEAIIAASAAVVPYSYFEAVAKAGADPAAAWVAAVPEAYAIAAAQAGFDPVRAWREAVSSEYLVAS